MILPKKEQPCLLSVRQIWNKAPSQSMSDLVYFNEEWLCVFSEGDKKSLNFKRSIRIISSLNGIDWKSIAYIVQEDISLENPKFSIFPNGQLCLLIEGVAYDQKGQAISRQSRVSFSKDGRNWSSFCPVLSSQESLWRLAWNKNQAFGVSYSFIQGNITGSNTALKLYMTENGIDFSFIAHLDIPGDPTEGAIGFIDQGQLLGLFKRNKRGDHYAWAGSSYYPFFSWRWRVAHYSIGEPTFIKEPNGRLWAAGRIFGVTPYGLMEKVALLRFSFDFVDPVLILPGGGETGHPGLVYDNHLLWLSYHSSHEGSTAIYLAQIKLPS